MQGDGVGIAPVVGLDLDPRRVSDTGRARRWPERDGLALGAVVRALGIELQLTTAIVDGADHRPGNNQLAPLVHALNGDGYQAVMAKAALKVKGVIPSTTMRLPNIGPDATQLDKAEEGMRAAGLL